MYHRLVFIVALCALVSTTRAAPLLVVFVADGTSTTEATTAQLAAIVADGVGEPVTTAPAGNALQHWSTLRAGDGALVAVESVQFAAWRVRQQDYHPLAVSERTVSYSVVTRPGITVLDVEDLAGLLIAVPAPPSLPALQLLALFPDPLRAPRLRHVDELAQALALLRTGSVDAAVVRESVSRTLTDVHEVLTLEETPVAVVSVAPEADGAMLARLREYLLMASGVTATDESSPLGVLRAADGDELGRYARLLGGTWGSPP